MKQPRLKAVHRARVFSGGRIRIGLAYGVASELSDDESGGVAQLIRLMDGTREEDALVAALGVTHPQFDPQSVRDAVRALESLGFLEDANAAPPPELTTAELLRCDRTLDYFAMVDTQPRSSRWEQQVRLKHASVSILGLGGIGSAIAASLTATGVGRLHLMDFDQVESSNLCRQILYSEEDIGRAKVDSALARLKALNSNVELSGERVEVRRPEDLERCMQGCDVFVIGADTPDDIDLWTNDVALRLGRTWFTAGYGGPLLSVSGFIPGQTPCWRCLLHFVAERQLGHEGPSELLRPMLVPHPSICPTVNIAAHLCALEIIKHLSGLGSQVLGKRLFQNLARYDQYELISPPVWDDCPACGQQRALSA